MANLVGGPEAGGQHAYDHVIWQRPLLLCFPLVETRVLLPSQLQVVDHTLHLRKQLG